MNKMMLEDFALVVLATIVITPFRQHQRPRKLAVQPLEPVRQADAR